VRIGFLQLNFFFLPHVGNGSNFSILILSFLCTVQSLFCAVEYLYMGLGARRQTVNVLFLPLLSGGSHEPDCMRLRAGVEWAFLLRILPVLQAIVGCFR
jgi:hypothetical protein